MSVKFKFVVGRNEDLSTHSPCEDKTHAMVKCSSYGDLTHNGYCKRIL